MATNDIERAPIWDDVTSLRGPMLPAIDIIYGGFPCQDISVAGLGAGLEGQRSGLFFQIVRLAKETGAPFIFLENVPAIRTRGLSRVCFELATLGYDMRWTVLSAASVGACHQRDRWFLLAHSNSLRLREQHEQKFNKQTPRLDAASTKGDVANPMCARLEGYRSAIRDEKEVTKPCGYGRWESEPTTRGRDHGIQNRMDRLRSLGNSVVPLQVKAAFKKLMGIS